MGRAHLLTRGKFIQSSVLAGLSLYLPAVLSKQTKVLILGGTSFAGPYIVKEAISRGWNITLFNRGITNPQLFPELRKIKGDRLKKEEVQQLSAEDWDFVIDTWSKDPHAIQYTVELLKEKVSYYAYVSSVAVYGGKNFRKAGINEGTALPVLEPLSDDATKLDYTKCKIYGESIVKENFPLQHGIFRAHTIYGLDMATGSLNNPSIGIASRAYWPVRIDKGGDILAPGEKTDTCQYTGVKDLAKFIVHCVEQKYYGIYNVFTTLTMDELFASLIAIKNVKPDLTLIWVPAAFIFSAGLESFSDIPLWVSHTETENGFFQIRTDKAIKDGMQITPAAETFQETKEAFYKYHAEFNFADEKKGIKLAKVENEVLTKWKNR